MKTPAYKGSLDHMIQDDEQVVQIFNNIKIDKNHLASDDQSKSAIYSVKQRYTDTLYTNN